MLHVLMALVNQREISLAEVWVIPELGWGIGLFGLGLLSALAYVRVCSAGWVRPRPALAALVGEKPAPPAPPPDSASQIHKLETIGRLASGVAHDLNNILTVILGYSELLQRHLPPDTQADTLAAEIRRSGERAASLTRQLLSFSRPQQAAPGTLELNAVVRDTARMLERLIGEDIELTIRLTSNPLLVLIDVTQLEQVLINLVVNARDAMPAGGKLSIETCLVSPAHRTASGGSRIASAQASLVVRDTGCGMAAGVQQRIFEPFFSTKEPGKGTGLGLATVKDIVTASGGSISVESEPNRGSTFCVCLPVVEMACASQSSPITHDPPARQNVTVLLAEDDDYLRVLVKNVLTHHGYQVLEARASQDALQLAADHQGRIDLLLADVVMPQMSGRELATRLMQTKPDLRILYMSGYPPDAVGRHGVLENEVAFLQKPFTSTALQAKIQEVLHQNAVKAL